MRKDRILDLSYTDQFHKEEYKKLFKKFAKDEHSLIEKTPWSKIVMFDGFMEQMKKIAQIYQNLTYKYNRKTTYDTCVVFPPTGFFNENDILELNEKFIEISLQNNALNRYKHETERKDTFVQFLMNKKKLSKEVSELFADHAVPRYWGRTEWNDKEIYRIISLVHFVEQNTQRTYGEFLEQNEAFLEKELEKSDWRMFEPYADFVKNALKGKNVLLFDEKSIKKTEDLISGMTKNDVLELMSLPPKTVPITKHTKVLEIALESARNNTSLTKDGIFISLSKIGLEMSSRKEYLKKNEFLEVSNLFQSGIKTFESTVRKLGIHPFVELLMNTIEEHHERLTIIDIMVLLRFLLKNNYVIQSSDLERTMEVFTTGIEKTEDPVVFIQFLTKTFLHHEGLVPNYEEWMNFLSTMEDDEIFSYPFSIALSLIIENDEIRMDSKSVGVVEQARAKYDKIILDHERDH